MVTHFFEFVCYAFCFSPKERQKISVALMTMEGPAGVYINHEALRPEITDSIATKLASTAMDSGVVLILRAAAAGIMSKAVISKTPTIFIAIVMTNAVISINAVCTLATLMPSTAANSGSTVILISDFHNDTSNKIAMLAPE